MASTCLTTSAPAYLVEFLAEWEVTHGAGSMNNVAPDTQTAQNANAARSDTRIRPAGGQTPTAMPSDPENNDGWDTPTGAEAESAAGAILCTIAGIVTAGVGLVICVVLVVAVIVISIILQATGNKP